VTLLPFQVATDALKGLGIPLVRLLTAPLYHRFIQALICLLFRHHIRYGLAGVPAWDIQHTNLKSRGAACVRVRDWANAAHDLFTLSWRALGAYADHVVPPYL
jgi:hypothetical protein